MSDLISRQVAIKELESGKDKKAKGEIGGFYNQIIENDIEKLRKLPSAQAEIIHCKDCKRFVSKVWLYAGGLADIEGRCGWTGFRVMPHDYCSYAIRREDE